MPDWLPSGVADAVVFTPLRIVFLIVVALISRYVLVRLIRRAVRRATGLNPQFKIKAAQALVAATTLPAERRNQRIQALGSLAQSVVTFTIIAVTALMVLAELGFNITTIVAGTSVLALTLGIGLQSLVKDLVSGVFMLIEDQLGVGDYIDMDKASGTVEEIGLRVTQLRDPKGIVWYVRNGEVLRVGNFSQGGPGEPEPDHDPDPDPEPTTDPEKAGPAAQPVA